MRSVGTQVRPLPKIDCALKKSPDQLQSVETHTHILILILPSSFREGNVIPILEVEKVKPREIKKLARGHKLSMDLSQHFEPRQSSPCAFNYSVVRQKFKAAPPKKTVIQSEQERWSGPQWGPGEEVTFID
jgi:hypothetical protein